VFWKYIHLKKKEIKKFLIQRLKLMTTPPSQGYPATVERGAWEIFCLEINNYKARQN
jgi:hypothetical protein